MTTIKVLILLLLALVTVIHVRAFKSRHRVKHTILQCNIGETNNVAHGKGLLSGIYDITKAKFYSDNISIKSSYELLKDPHHIYNLCLKNSGGNITALDDNLKRISDKAKEFVQSDEIWNRKQLICSIENIITDKGKFVCLLAGKNTGKSVVLNSIEKRFPEKVYKVNLRIYPDILRGLLWTLRDRQTKTYKPSLTDAISKVIGQFFGDSKMFTDKEFIEKLNIALGKRNPDGLQSVITCLMENLGAITLVIDEANIALTITDKTSADKITATKEALALFTSLTKEDKKVTIINSCPK